jgi:predicted RND superfamily exporter protein
MFVLRMKLNFFNMIVVPTVFGTSIDNAIHIYHRYEEMGKRSLMKVLKTSGGAALMSSMTNILGFLGLVFANHSGLASIGKLAIAGMAACLFTTLIYFPAALQWLSDKK